MHAGQWVGRGVGGGQNGYGGLDVSSREALSFGFMAGGIGEVDEWAGPAAPVQPGVAPANAGGRMTGALCHMASGQI